VVGQQLEQDHRQLHEGYLELESIVQDNLEAIGRMAGQFEQVRRNVYHEEQACNIWTTAFFKTYTEIEDPTNPTSEKLALYFNSPSQFGRLTDQAFALKEKYKFFHWPLEFPDVWAQGGFDVMLGNPPWERIKLQQQEFFATRESAIASAANAAARNRLINELPQTNPGLYVEYIDAMHGAEATGKFLREGGRCKLTAVGDINTYSIFAEIFTSLLNKKGRSGFIVPTGIATDDSNKAFFGNLVEQNKLVSLFDFENREKIFPDVDSRYKFSLLTIAGSNIGIVPARYGFFLTRVEHLQDHLRIFSLIREDFLRLNPNTKTCPVFRTSVDAALTAKIYKQVPVLINETTNQNPWSAYYIRLVDLGDHKDDIELFHLRDLSIHNVPVYEAKLFWQMDHRLSSFDDVSSDDIVNGTPRPFLSLEKQNSHASVLVRYYAKKVLEQELLKKYPDYTKSYFLVWRDVSNATNERSSISSIIPKALASRSCPAIGFDHDLQPALLVANLNSIIYDYFVRQKISGVHFNWGLVKQTPIIPPENYSSNILPIVKNSLELIYTSWDIKPFADDMWNNADDSLKEVIKQQWQSNAATTGGHVWMPPEWCADYGFRQEETAGCPLPPFKWDEERRAELKAELDAIYAQLYGLSTKDLRYILDPQEVYGAEFPGETFRVLKEKEMRQYGEYRTRRLILEAWERLNEVQSKKEITVTKPNYVDLTTPIELMKEWSLNDGLYNIQDCCRITRLSTDKVRRWFKELYNEDYEGFGAAKIADIQNLRISFHGLIELVVIGTLRDAKIKLKDILKARKQLGTISKKQYPFATNNVNNLKVAGKTITFNLPEGNIDLNGSDQFNFDFIKAFFRDIIFDGDIALRMIPEKGKGKIIIDPKEANGKPAIIHKEVPVDSILQFYLGPASVKSIMQQFELSEEEVLAAVDYFN
jgi:uncharacterized protein (DUF433 family)